MRAGPDDRPEPAIDLVCDRFAPALDLLCGLGLRIDCIYPADDPHSAVLSRDGRCVRLTSRPDAPAPDDRLPAFEPDFVLSRAGNAGGAGRAGMAYRDLIPGRLGGRYIASHITVPAGPVADWVHYHRVRLQLIVVIKGWAVLAYEDQGEPFRAVAGDVIVQPPEIRHRVLESGDGLAVVEIGCPALHPTFADHDLHLPNGFGDPDRRWSGQAFRHFKAEGSPWAPFHGGEAQDSGLAAATNGLAEARWLRGGKGGSIAMPPSAGELVFGFVAEGRGQLERSGATIAVGPADSFAIPPDEAWKLNGLSPDFRLLHVASATIAYAA